MTLCIATKCRENETGEYLVFCSDMKIGNWAASAEIGLKMQWAGAYWPALVSGDLSRCTQLARTFSATLNRLTPNKNNVYRTMKGIGEVFREELADEIVHKNLSVSYEYLKANKRKFPQQKVLETYNQISQIDSNAELIVAGFIESHAYIFVVERDCSVTHHDNFACIGTGAYVAEPALYQRHQSRALGLGRTLYHTYEAKRLGEIAEGVGHSTIIVVIGPPKSPEEGLQKLVLSREGMTFLEEKYEEYGLKPTFKFEWPKPKESLREESEFLRAHRKKKSKYL